MLTDNAMMSSSIISNLFTGQNVNPGYRNPIANVFIVSEPVAYAVHSRFSWCSLWHALFTSLLESMDCDRYFCPNYLALDHDIALRLDKYQAYAGQNQKSDLPLHEPCLNQLEEHQSHPVTCQPTFPSPKGSRLQPPGIKNTWTTGI